MESLKQYKELKYGEINKFLREATNTEKLLKENPEDSVVRDIVNIDRMMSNDGKLDGRVMYRGFSKGFIPMALETSGGVIVNKAYSSVTFSLDDAKKFVDTETGCCVLVFVIPRGMKYYEYPEDKNESEVLVQRNTQFIIDVANSKFPVYKARLVHWEEPAIVVSDELDSKLVSVLSDTLVARCAEVGEENFREERYSKYLSDSDDPDEDFNQEMARDDADEDVLKYCRK